MDDENKPEGEGGRPQDPEGTPQDTQQGGGGGANPHRLERRLANRDRRIRELEEQLAASKGGAKTIEERTGRTETPCKRQDVAWLLQTAAPPSQGTTGPPMSVYAGSLST